MLVKLINFPYNLDALPMKHKYVFMEINSYIKISCLMFKHGMVSKD